MVFLLSLFSLANAFHTFLRRRNYRLFESNIDTPQNTPSAHRVRVDSSPVSSPLRFLTTILGDTSAESRTHPDPTRDVWEIAMWDPSPASLRLFCLFSPGHVLVYWLFLPTVISDPRPSVTVFTTIILQLLLTTQMLLLQTSFSQQEKDSAIVQQQVMSEYDIKFVHPRLNPLMRDVGTQFSGPDENNMDAEGNVDTYTPAIVLKRSFQTNPNPNYAKHVDPDNTSCITQRLFSPGPSFISTAQTPQNSRPFPTSKSNAAIRQPQFRKSTPGIVSTSTSTGDGGNLGIYSHANSPLKKATSMYDIQGRGREETPRNSFQMAAREIAEDRDRSTSPTKKQPNGRLPFPEVENDRRTSAPNPFGLKARPGNVDSPYRRGPSRW